MVDVIVLIGVIVGASMQIQAVWDMGRTVNEGEDKTSVQAQAFVLAAAGSVIAVGALASALLFAPGF
ncbi:hypothetical protein AB0Q95_12425 [Streptomyces sp. NPDC059900]|uniref:hypothetical protein n=1 Tax=Streptomyces sp. NPDC059900 TaxID=3155816 RepID=UPI003434DCB8